MDLAATLHLYLDGPRQLRALVADMNDEHLRQRPVPGKWSTLEVICHLVDFDPILADRMKRIIAEDRPQLLGADEQKFAAALRYHDRDAAEELALLEKTRSQMGRILKQLKEDAFAREGVHNERGVLTLARMLEIAAKHIPHHLAFIQEKRHAMGLPAKKSS